MKKRFLVRAECGHCEQVRTFTILSERDAEGRTVVVCTTCGRRQPRAAPQV